MAVATCVAAALERRRPLPVDRIIPDPLFTSTHAIAIDATPEQVWPWIAQRGAGLAGSISLMSGSSRDLTIAGTRACQPSPVSTVRGQRYIVSMFGTNSDWVQNLDVPPMDQAPVHQEYVRVASSGRKHFPPSVGAPLSEFAAIAAQYPVVEVSGA